MSNQRLIELIGCLHNGRQGHALIYVSVNNRYYRLSKQVRGPLEYMQMADRQACDVDRKNVSRYAPGYASFDSISNAPLDQLQLERMVLRLQAAGHLTDEQATG